MPLGFYLLDISAVESDQDRSQFSEKELTNLAQKLIASDDLIHPILVTQINPVRFKVIQGHFAYFAAVKASEMDPTFDEIRAIIVPKELQEDVLAQYRLLLPEAGGDPDPDQDAHLTKDDLRELEQRLRQDFQVKFDLLNNLLSSQQNQIQNFLMNDLVNKLQDLLKKKPKLSISEINTLDLEALKARMQELSPQNFLDDETKEDFLTFIRANRPFANFDALYHKIKSVKNPKSSRKSLVTKSNLKKIVRD
jgi:hypothetical protein